jgi:nucleoside-diphosphate-sugar epimerase
VGTHTVAALEDRKHTVYGVDRKLGHDLSFPAQAQRLADWQPDVIVHLASACSTLASIRDPLGTFSDTVLPLVYTLEVARRVGAAFIHTSSVKARDGLTGYGAAKKMTELWAKEYRATYHMPLIINRPGTIYGPGQEGSPESGWIAWFCKARAENLPVVLNGNGQQIRDLLHVSDYVKLLVLQVQNLETYDRGRIYDVGGGPKNAVTVEQMAKHLGLTYTFGPARYGDWPKYIGKNDAPDWKPEVNWWESETLAFW